MNEGQNQEKNNNAAKEALKESSKQAGKKLVNKVVSKLIPYIIPVILIIFAGALLLGVFNAVGDKVQELVNSIIDFFTIEYYGAIDVKDTDVDQIINSIADMGINLDSLKLMGDIDYNDPNNAEKKQESMRKYIKAFYEAQAITQTLNTKPNWFENWTRGDKVYGNVYVYRTNSNATTSNDRFQLDYKPLDEFQTKANNKDSDIYKFFTMDTDGNLVFASIINGDVQIFNKDYKSVISQYTTQMNFFLYLAMVTENPEFVYKVTDLVKDSKIDITIMDNKITTTTSGTETKTPVTQAVASDGSLTGTPTKGTPTQTTIAAETVTTLSPQPQITYVKTWFCEQTITYTKDTIDNPAQTYTYNRDNEETMADETAEDGTVNNNIKTWYIDKSKTMTTSSHSEKFKETGRSEVQDRTGERGDGESSFIGLLDVDLKIPNSTREEKAGQNFVSGAELLCYLLQKDSTLQNLELVIRYILYKYTGDDYGVTQLDFSIFNARELSRIPTSGITAITEYIHYWQRSSAPPTSADGTKYIIYDDGEGNLIVGYGVDIYNGGYAELFEQSGYTINVGEEVDKEFVDALEKQAINDCIALIKAKTAELDLKEYQIQALVSRAYTENCGASEAVDIERGDPPLNFVDSYKKYWNEETDNLYKDKNANANFNHSLYVQYMSKPVQSGGRTTSELENRRRSEWILFQTGYNSTNQTWYSSGGDILKTCEEVMNDLLANNVHYSQSNLVWGNIVASDNFSRYGCCCATYVSIVLYRSGALTEEFINQYNYNYTGTMNDTGVNGMMKGAGWIHVSESEAEPGDICVYNGHAFIYAGGNEIWDQTSGCISSSGSQPTRGTSSLWSSYINNHDVDVWRKP